MLHASPEWSTQHLEWDASEVADELLGAFFATLQMEPSNPSFVKAHRWRFAQAERPAEVGCLFDRGRRIAVCGDWLAGSRVEGAFLSGMAAAGRILSLDS